MHTISREAWRVSRPLQEREKGSPGRWWAAAMLWLRTMVKKHKSRCHRGILQMQEINQNFGSLKVNKKMDENVNE